LGPIKKNCTGETRKKLEKALFLLMKIASIPPKKYNGEVSEPVPHYHDPAYFDPVEVPSMVVEGRGYIGPTRLRRGP
jgi:hypothetical protein